MIGLAVVAAYFGIGVLLAKWDLPRLWKAARAEYSHDQIARDVVRMGTAMTLLFWPIRLPIIGLWTLLGSAVDAYDPKNVRKELDDARRRIAELERDLGIE